MKFVKFHKGWQYFMAELPDFQFKYLIRWVFYYLTYWCMKKWFRIILKKKSRQLTQIEKLCKFHSSINNTKLMVTSPAGHWSVCKVSYSTCSLLQHNTNILNSSLSRYDAFACVRWFVVVDLWCGIKAPTGWNKPCSTQ